MDKKGVSFDSKEIKKVYRIAKQSDVDTWQEAQNLEQETMFASRKIASELNLDMKISDVEYQGDKTKATFYYTADGRVDFRELIKSLQINLRFAWTCDKLEHVRKPEGLVELDLAGGSYVVLLGLQILDRFLRVQQDISNYH